MSIQEKFQVSLPNEYVEIFKNFESLISRDKEYQKVLKNAIEKDKRIMKHGDRSVKIRYLISKYIKEAKLKMIEDNQ